MVLMFKNFVTGIIFMEIRLLPEKGLRILALKNSNYFASNEKNSNKTSIYKYRVKRGDSISEIAHKFGISVIKS